MPVLDFNVLVRLLAARDAYRGELQRAQDLMIEARKQRDASAAWIAKIEQALVIVSQGIEIRFDTEVPRTAGLDALIAMIVPPPPPAPQIDPQVRPA